MAQNHIVLQNDDMRVVFDARKASILELLATRTGWRIQNRHEMAMPFRLIAPMPERRYNLATADFQDAPQVEAGSESLHFFWPTLNTQHAGRLQVSLRLTATLQSDGLHFAVEVANESPLPIETVDWPCIGDIAMPPGDDTLDFMARGYGTADRRSLLPIFTNKRGYWGTDYPTQDRTLCGPACALMTSPRQGLYLGLHDRHSATPIKLTWELVPGYRDTTTSAPADGARLRFYASQFLFAQPGETRRSDLLVLRPYQGSWHRGLDHYRAWRATWHRQPACPSWAKDIHSWQQIHINSPEDDLRVRYVELPRFGEDCAEHGVAALQLVGWNHGGQDRGNPMHVHDPRLGTREDLKQAIERIRSMGVRVIPFCKFCWMDRSTEWYRTEGVRHATKDPYGEPHYHPGYTYVTPANHVGVNTRRFAPTCYLSRGYQDFACEQLRSVMELSADGMLFDETSNHGSAVYCFDPRHGHRVPEYVRMGDPLLANRFRAMVSDEYLLAGEDQWDNVNHVYALSYTRIGAEHIPWQRYADPDIEIMVGVHGYDDREKINQCLMYRYVISYEPLNFKGRLDDFPKTVAYGRLVDEFRRRHRQRLWDGVECLDTLGAEVRGPVAYSVLCEPDGLRAVVLANHRSEAAEVHVEIGGAMTAASPEEPEPRRTDGRIRVPARSAVVVFETGG